MNVPGGNAATLDRSHTIATLDKHIIENRKRRVSSLAEALASEKAQIDLL